MRVLQGLAGGALLPTSQALIQEAFLSRASFPRQRAVFGVCVIIGPMLGPTLGGYLTDYHGWRSIFFINFPFRGAGNGAFGSSTSKTLTCIGSSGAIQGRHRWPRTPGRPGWEAMQFVLEQRPKQDEWFYSNAIKACAVLAVIGLPLLVYRELKIRSPILNLRLFRNKVFAAGMVLMLQLGFVLYSLIFFIPNFVTTVRGMSATQSGLLFIPMGGTSMIMMALAGALIAKVQPRILVTIGGTALFCATIWAMSHFSSATGAPDFFYGLRSGWASGSLSGSCLSTRLSCQSSQVKRWNRPLAALLNLARQVEGAIGIALLNTYSRSSFQRQAFVDLSGKASPIDLNYGAAAGSGRATADRKVCQRP